MRYAKQFIISNIATGESRETKKMQVLLFLLTHKIKVLVLLVHTDKEQRVSGVDGDRIVKPVIDTIEA